MSTISIVARYYVGVSRLVHTRSRARVPFDNSIPPSPASISRRKIYKYISEQLFSSDSRSIRFPRLIVN